MKKLVSHFKKHKKKFLLAGVALCLIIVLAPKLALAAEPVQSSKAIQEVYEKLVNVLLVVMKVLQRVIWPVLLMIGGLLKNDILFSAGMEETMLTIWTNIRNIVNILFVIVLLGIAFYNVLGGGAQDYHWKTILPKFIIALVAVNFSFLGVKVVLDGVNVVTTALFALPGAVERDLKAEDVTNLNKDACEGIYGKENYEQSIADAEKESQNQGENSPKPFCDKNKSFTKEGQEFFSKFDSNNAAIVMAVNLAQINLLDVVNVTQPDLKNLAINVMFSVILYVVYAISFVVLLIILLTRMVVLWVAMVLSPLIAFSFVLPESLKSSLGGAGDLKTKFVKNAIVPIPIALVMSIGFIMLQSLKEAKFTGLTLGTSSMGVNLLTSGLSTLQEVIVAVGVVTVIWVGVFEAAKGTAAEGIVEKIRGAAEGFGKFAVTAPFKYAPILPVQMPGGKEEKISAAGLMKTFEGIPGTMEEKGYKEAERIREAYGFGGAGANIAALKKAETAKSIAGSALYQGQMRQLGNEEFQRELAKKLRTKPGQELRIERIEAGEHKYTWAKFQKELGEGKVPEEVMEKYLEELKKKRPEFQPIAPGLPPTAPPPKEEAGGKGGAKEAGEARVPTTVEQQAPAAAAAVAGAISVPVADRLVGAPNFAARKSILTDEQKKGLESYEKAHKIGDNAGKEKAKEGEAKDALLKIQELSEKSQEFNTDLKGANGMPEGEDKEKRIVELVVKRKQEVRQTIVDNHGGTPPADIDKRVNDIVQEEVDSQMKARGLKVGEIETPAAG